MQIVKIKSIKKINNDSKKYDITTEQNNNFFANNILVHNSNIRIGLIRTHYIYQNNKNIFVNLYNIIKYIFNKEKFVIGSHNVQRKINLFKKSIYQLPLNDQNKKFLSFLKKKFKAQSVILFGEIYGSKIQDLSYDTNPTYKFFDIYIDGKYVDFEDFIKYTSQFDIPIVPILYQGKFSYDIIKELSKGNTTLGNQSHIREGVVVKPVEERTHDNLGRVILKFINDDYLIRKNPTEFH